MNKNTAYEPNYYSIKDYCIVSAGNDGTAFGRQSNYRT